MPVSTSKYPDSDSAKVLEEQLATLNQYFDPYYSQSLVTNVLAPINERYFKCKFVGFDQLPERNRNDRPLIYVSNHSGMAFPWDAMIFSGIILQREHYQFRNVVRTLAAPALSESNLMNPYLIKNFWMLNGSVDARFINFETMMNDNESNLLIYPEGVPGIGKGFNRKYQLQRFATSFVRMTLKYKTDVIPFATVNGEYINS
jgi:1-acyl-sn-glycerol-3-phosphate acyltransferase